MKITKNETFHFKKLGIEGWVYTGKDNYPSAGMYLVKTKRGHQTIIKHLKSDWFYFVISGNGYFMIGGKKYSVKKHDLIMIPKNTSFYYSGSLEMFSINVPAWEEKYEVTIGPVKKNKP